MTSLFRDLLKDENGATAIEYSLLAAILSVAIIAAIQTVATQMNAVFSEVSSAMK